MNPPANIRPPDALTSDAATLRDARKLALASRWSGTGAAESLVWGECQGSAKTPYRVCLDTDVTGYKCTCPSRKHPCKHVAALGLLAAEQPALFAAVTPPDWVETWQANRAKKRATPAAPATPDADAQAARADAREQKVRAGMQELKLWLQDLARSGLTDDRVQTYTFWDQIAARMVDAQASGVGRRLRGLASIPLQGKADWAERLLDELSSLYLLADAYERIDSLPDDVQADLRTFAGRTYRQDDLLARPAVTDTWRVMGQMLEVEDRLNVRRVWLHGERTARKALLLDFVFGAAKFEETYTTGAAFNAALVFYPGAYPLRALLKQRMATIHNPHEPLAGFDCDDIPQALGRYADALARNPWVGRVPLGFSGVIPYVDGDAAYIRDRADNLLPLRTRNLHPWLFAAASGNQPLPVFGEWDGYVFQPLTLYVDGQMIAC